MLIQVLELSILNTTLPKKAQAKLNFKEAMAVVVLLEHLVYLSITFLLEIYLKKKLIDHCLWEMDKKYPCVYKQVRILKPIVHPFQNHGLEVKNLFNSVLPFHLANNI
jgi:hypothetical protein